MTHNIEKFLRLPIFGGPVRSHRPHPLRAGPEFSTVLVAPISYRQIGYPTSPHRLHGGSIAVSPGRFCRLPLFDPPLVSEKSEGSREGGARARARAGQGEMKPRLSWSCCGCLHGSVFPGLLFLLLLNSWRAAAQPQPAAPPPQTDPVEGTCPTPTRRSSRSERLLIMVDERL